MPEEKLLVERRRWRRIERLALEPARRPSRWRQWVLLLLVWIFGVLCGRVFAAERVTLIVRPLVMLQRGDIRIEAHVPRHPANGLLAIAWNSDVGSMGSFSPRVIDGENGPVLHEWWLIAQPPARYVFVATLIEKSGRVAGRAKAEIHVPETDIR